MKKFCQVLFIAGSILGAGAADATSEQVHVFSPDPYANQMDVRYEIVAPSGAQLASIHFDYIDVEQGYDFVYIIDEKGNTTNEMTGSYQDYTVEVQGSRVEVRLVSDSSVVGRGFSVDRIEVVQSCVCPAVWAPACGSNGTTYGNTCQATCVEVDVLYLGQCEWREVTDTIESAHPYGPNQRLAWSLHPPEETPLIKIPFDSFELEDGYDIVRVFGGGIERAQYTGSKPAFEVIVPGPTASVVMNTDGSVEKDGFSIKGWFYLVTPETSACKLAGGECVLPRGGCDSPSYIDESLDCLGLGQVCCMQNPHDPRCDDGTDPLCDMVVPVCANGDILAYQNNCYSCVNPETCEPNPIRAEIGEACDGPENIECVEGAVCVDYDGQGNDAWGVCHGYECNGPERVECPTGKHCQLYWRHVDSWGWCAPGSPEGGMCAGFAGFQCLDDPHLVCDLAPDLVCRDDVADIAGTCTFVPEICPELDEPVCGCDGRTYENDCMRLKHNMGKEHDGPCCFPSGCSGQICGSTHVTTTCEFLPEYACYHDAEVTVCGHDENGRCAWLDVTQGSLDQCLAQYQDAAGLGDFCGGIAGIQCALGLVCALDGDYPDAGGVCEQAGTWHRRKVTQETSHPYENNLSMEYSLRVVGAEQIKVHFSAFNVEANYDWVSVVEHPDCSWTGELGPFWTAAIEGDTLTLLFTSDDSVSEYGFKIDEIEYFM